MAATGARIRVPVAVACRVLGLSTQGYYKWLRNSVWAREKDDRVIIGVLRGLHAEDPEFGYRFLTDELEKKGIICSENRVHRLCRIAGIQASHHKKKGRAEHPTREGKLYLCSVKDVFSNRIVGHSIDTRMESSLARRAIHNAIVLRDPDNTNCHSDRGSQFRSRKVVRLLHDHGLRGSMGRVGAAGDNASMESFHSLL